MLPTEPRLPDVRRLVERGQYFVLHAPRQTGKTTTLAELATTLTAGGRFAAVRFSCETGEVAEDDFVQAQQDVLQAIRDAAQDSSLPPECHPPEPWPDSSPGQMLRAALRAWAAQSPRPLVLFFDEIDALRGRSLISVLRQLRDGATATSTPFPHSVALCGLRDVRDYKVAAGGDPTRLGTSSPFNIKAESFRLSDFTFAQVAELYTQHSEATGQRFTAPAVQRAFEASQGQPWLVNALAAEVIDEMKVPLSEEISDEHMDEAVERLIVDRATHLDSLVARLYEPRVRRIMEPLIAGTDPDPGYQGGISYDDDVAYVRDLGLITNTPPLHVANPIYQEVVLRVLAQRTEDRIEAEPRSFVTPDGRLDFLRLLTEFAAFWKQHGEILTARQTYHEAACQLVFLGFLHRVVNGGGRIDREYGLGRGRIDLMLHWPHRHPDGTRAWQWEAIELKVHHPGARDPVPEGLAQLDGYLDRAGLDTGTLIVFDRRPTAPPITERTTITKADSPAGRVITLLRA
jgi:AAA ATPase-like protein